eukprot:TRINITY_DN64386_c0_g1_i1.p1 TRINITY_DN64386_c0_g1~~TRINITY_DN64386_c0_g1_i1.p1  ORF type:complete len:533 (-),score=59.75 TRINITY_DN64386_c0_g1_i1:211-1611(-)
MAVADPLSGKSEYWLGIGLNGKHDGDGIYKFPRLPLTLVFVLDVSGSMSGSSLASAQQALKCLMGHLKEGDKFALVTFDNKGKTIFGLQDMGTTSVESLHQQIDSLRAGGGTNFMAGWDCAMECLKEQQPQDDGDVQRVWFSETRLFFLTDMNINVGTADGASLVKEIQGKAENESIFTTIIGFGFNFDVSLTNELAKCKACNYHSVLDPKDFVKQMEEDFDYLVCPNAFDIRVVLPPVENDHGIKAQHVYGAPNLPEDDVNNNCHPEGTLVYINSSFPSAKPTPTSTKGGIVLAKLSVPEDALSTTATTAVNMHCSYATRDGKQKKSTHKVPINPIIPENQQTEQTVFPTSGTIAKAVLLTQYVNLMKHFLGDIHAGKETPSVSTEWGIPHPEENVPEVGKFDKRAELQAAYAPLLRQFKAHYVQQMAIHNDGALQQWLDKLDEYIGQCDEAAKKNKDEPEPMRC